MIEGLSQDYRDAINLVEFEGLLRLRISLDTPLGHTAPISDGGVHGKIERRAGLAFLEEEDGGRVARVTW